MRDAVLNLALNAITALPRGGKLELSVARAHARVRLTITDDGPGISAELQRRLGQPFVSGTEGGTGLGVMLAESVTRQHGGELRFESVPGQGARALLELPLSASRTTRGSELTWRTVLIVDDESSVLFLLREVLEERGHEVLSATSGVEARALADSRKLEEIELVLTDFAMPELDGLGLMAHLRRQNPDLPVILLTARGSERLAARAIKEGAFDYLPKPFELEELEAVVARALETGSLRREARRAAAPTLLGRPFVGRAPAFRRVVDRALKLADRNVPVLVRGETGSGKELLASLLHTGGPRRSAPLVRFNCAAIAAELAESELFGHARGAFTGASAPHRGYFAQADGGTLVLDEVGELPQLCNPSCCVPFSSAKSSRWAARSRRSTCASSPAPIAISQPR